MLTEKEQERLQYLETRISKQKLLFAYLINRGYKPQQAYVTAGYKPDSKQVASYVLRKEKRCAELINLLKKADIVESGHNRAKLEDYAWDTLADAIKKRQNGTVAKMLEFLQKWYPSHKDPGFETIDEDKGDIEDEFRQLIAETDASELILAE
ncbi:MAG: hypothetical protein AMJ75_00415 [Phycisphaerae bacterium SM1_79]|nr:MAG: hypothetical protein AMJ75_00415 [Phycisphaerae bacterium SM1_79]